MLRSVLAARKAQTAQLRRLIIHAGAVRDSVAPREGPPSPQFVRCSFNLSAPRVMDHSPGFLAHVEARRQQVHEVTVAETLTALAADPTTRLLDVREDREWMAGHATGATHAGRGIIERDIEKMVPALDTPIYLYCGGGYRSALSADSLQQMGYTAVHSVTG